MSKRSKFINLLCSAIFGVVLCAVVLLVLLLNSEPAFADDSDLVLRTDSDDKTYDGEPLMDRGWMLIGELKPGHEAQAEVTGSRTNVGESENTATLRITDETGADVTSEYKIRYEYGTLEVRSRPLTVTSANAFRLYDKEDTSPLTAPSWTLTELLVPGHTASVEVTGVQEGIGMSSNTIASVVILDAEGNDVTSNYNLLVREGLLAITEEGKLLPGEDELFNGESDLLPPEDMKDTVIYSVYGSASEYVYLKIRSYGDYNGKGWEEAPEYPLLIENTYSPAYLTATALKEAGVKAKTVRIKSFCNQYGLPYYFAPGSAETQADESFFQGNTGVIYDVDYYGTEEGVDSLYSPHIAYEKEYRAFVYENYLTLDARSLAYMKDLIQKEGFSADSPTVIADVAAYIQSAASYEKEYPVEMEEESNVAIAFLETYQEGVCRHYASAAVLLYRALGIPARYTVGALAEAKENEWTDVKASSAHAWVEVYLVEVTGGTDEANRVTLAPQTTRFAYDGLTHESLDLLTGFEEYEALGYTYKAKVSGRRSAPGTTETEIEEIRIYNPLGNDVTFSFRIEKEPGILQVYRKQITFTSQAESGVYGSLSSSPKVTPEPAFADEGLTAVYVRTLEYTGVGMWLNEFDVTLLNSSGADVTGEYWILCEYGQIRITPRSITLKAGDAEKVYDGTPLTCNDFTVAAGSLLKGHTIAVCETKGSQKAVGRSENEIIYVAIHDEKGKSVTRNYTIALLPGQLKVKLR